MRNRVVLALALASSLSLMSMAQTLVNGGRRITGTWDASGAVSTRPAKAGTTLPAACIVGEQFFRTDAAAGQNLYLCTATNTWTQSSGGGGGSSLPGMTGNQDRVLSNNGSVADWRSLGGDVSGAPGAISVDKIKGQAVSTTAPASGEALIYDGSAYQPRPVRYPFQDGTFHFVEYFPTCGLTSDGTIGILGWFKGGNAYFTGMTCGSPIADYPLGGITPATTNNSNQSHYLATSALKNNFGATPNRWTFEWTFTPDTSGADTVAWLVLGDGTSVLNALGLRHDAAAESGFTLCVVANGAGKCFAGTPGTGLLAWDTNRHTVRLEKVSATHLRGQIDSGTWYNFYSVAGTDGPNDLYGVTFPTAVMFPEFFLRNITATGQKKMILHRFEMLYGY
jgi:hypothetical protein